MKTKKILSAAAFCVITTLLLSSCGIMKNNDFSSQKYTNFKKGKTTVIINQAEKEKKDVDLFAAVTDQNKVTKVETIATDNTSTKIPSKPEIKKESGNKVGHTNITTKETKKEKLTRVASYVKERMINKPNTTANNDDGLSVLWVVVLVLLILWAVGLWGFGLGGLINVLLVIALILLILWLLQVV
jgi:hypothetical protein